MGRKNILEQLPANTRFCECGGCGEYHPDTASLPESLKAEQVTPMNMDCRSDDWRFNFSELDEFYGEGAWNEWSLEYQMDQETRILEADEELRVSAPSH